MTIRFRSAVRGVSGEHDTGTIRRDHLLHHHRHRRFVVVALGISVGDGARRPQRRPATENRVHQGIGADDVGEALVYPGKGHRGGVLGRGRGPHGHRYVGAEPGVGAHQFGPQVGGETGLVDQFGASLGQPPAFLGQLARAQPLAGLERSGVVAQSRGGQRIEVGPVLDHETGGNGQPGPGHLTQVGSLTTHRVAVGERQVGEPEDPRRGDRW